MRFLGNKRRLLEEIRQVVASTWGDRPGFLCDVFAGTGVVGADFRGRGWKVWSGDALRLSYWRQVALLEATPWLRYDRLGLGPVDLPGVLAHLAALPPAEGPLTRHYTPTGEAGRRYFRPEHAGQLDAALLALRQWRRAEQLCSVGVGLVMYSLLDAMSRVANISGVYAAYLKSWQPNTNARLRFEPPPVAYDQPVGRAHWGESGQWIGERAFDVAYFDPPYNQRQYPAYYHIPELLARWVDCDDTAALEAQLYGKTGLLPYTGSDLCRPSRVFEAFRGLLARCRAEYVVISYNEEGLLDAAAFEELLGEYSGGSFSLRSGLRRIPSKRFRSDKNRAGRAYKVLEGRRRDRVHEWLFVARRGRPVGALASA